MSGAASGLQGAGGLFGAIGAYKAGKAAKLEGQRIRAEKQFEAAQARQNAGQALAVGQRDAIEQGRQNRLIQSRIQALVAAGGGGTADPTIVNLIGNTAAEGAYQAAVALYQGEDKDRSLRLLADAKEYEGFMAEQSGEDKQDAYNMQALGSLFSSAGSFAGM
jgi:hypothetical protein